MSHYYDSYLAVLLKERALVYYIGNGFLRRSTLIPYYVY
jgi:hypothetical protein